MVNNVFRLLKYLKKYKLEAFLGPLFKLTEACFELAVPLVMADMIEKGIHGRNSEYIIRQGLLLLLLGILGMLFSVTAQYFSAKAAIGMASDLREDLFSCIINMSFRQFDAASPSGYIARLSMDVNQVQNCVNMCLRLFLRSPFIVFGAMIMAFHVDAENAVIFSILIPVLFLIVLGLIFITIPFYTKVQKWIERVVISVRENVTGIRVIRAFGRQEQEKNDFNKVAGALVKEQIFAGKISAVMNPLTYILVNFGVMVILYKGNIAIRSGNMLQGELVALLNYMSQILVEVIKMASLILFISKALSSAGRINSVFDRNANDGDHDHNRLRPDVVETDLIVEMDLIAETGPISEMVVNNIDFSYSGQGTKIIEEISFHVRSGEMIGIAGSMGMGKTTLLKLLAGYENPDSGEVIGFTDAPDGKRRLDLTNRISTVFQETSLFSGTVRDNLLLAKPDATDTEIEVALKVAQAFEFIDELPDKLESKLSKMGKNLSGGQRQRLSIARAILSGKEILLLDDSFSALDYLTESKIRAELLNRKKDHIIFLSSQRIASLMAADKILVLENGRLIGFDKHEKLISSCAAYQELCRSQGIE